MNSLQCNRSNFPEIVAFDKKAGSVYLQKTKTKFKDFLFNSVIFSLKMPFNFQPKML
jgi:hypothetical protein